MVLCPGSCPAGGQNAKEVRLTQDSFVSHERRKLKSEGVSSHESLSFSTTRHAIQVMAARRLASLSSWYHLAAS